MTIEQGWSRPVRNSRSVHQVRWTFERRRMTQPRLQWRRVLLTESYPVACLVRSLLVQAGFHPAPIPESATLINDVARSVNGAPLGVSAKTAQKIVAPLGSLNRKW